MFKFIIHSEERWTGYRIGRNPDLYTPLPLINFGSSQVGQGVRYSARWVDHDWVSRIHKLIQFEFVNEGVGLQSVPVEEGRFFSLEDFIVESPCWVLWDVLIRWWRSRWRRRRRSPSRSLYSLQSRCYSELVWVQEVPCESMTHRW
jgi:hypothetical protein